jgi:hypothetical protein
MTQKILPHIYLVPGLGADGRLFGRLTWDEGMQRTAIRWIEPLQHEKIGDYALRLSRQIDTSQPFVLVGVSLGGVMSIEIAKHICPEKIVLISSIKHKNEKPFYFALGSLFHATIWPPKNKTIYTLMVRMFFGKLSDRQFEIFKDMVHKTSPAFMKWAQMAIASWENTKIFDNLVHIHGSMDTIYPAVFIKSYIPVKGGTHYMIVNKAREISLILNEIIMK